MIKTISIESRIWLFTKLWHLNSRLLKELWELNFWYSSQMVKNWDKRCKNNLILKIKER